MTAQTHTNISIDDPRLTAYALGELPASEATEVATVVAASPELQAEVAAIRAFGASLEAELASEPAPELGDEARAAIVAAGVTPPAANDDDTPEVQARRWYQQPRWLVAAGLFVAAGAAAAIALSSGQNSGAPSEGAPEVYSHNLPTESPAATTPGETPPAGEVPDEDPSSSVADNDEAGTAERSSDPAVAAAGTETSAPRGRYDQPEAEASTAAVDEPMAKTGANGHPMVASKPVTVPRRAAAADPTEVPSSDDAEAAWLPQRVKDAKRNPFATNKPSAEDVAAHGRSGSSRALRGVLSEYEGDAVAGLDGLAAGGGGSGSGSFRNRGIGDISGTSAGPTVPIDANDDKAKSLLAADLDDVGGGRAASIPMLRGAGGIVVDTVTVPSGSIVTFQMPDGQLVRRHIGHHAYDPHPYWYDAAVRRWYYDYDYYYYGQAPQGGAGERYAPIYESPFKRVDNEPLSSFSTDVDTASYANVRRFLERNQRPPRDAVRIEEMVNAFTYETPTPRSGEPLTVQSEVAGCPWAPNHRLVRVTVAARDVARTQRPAGNLVFLVDTSGSMGSSKKLPLLKRALRELVNELDERDTVSIVTYAGRAGVALKPTNGSEKAKILRAVRNLRASGMTNGSAGLEKAYEIAREQYIAGGTNRVLLATDGDFNAGMTNRYALVQQVASAAAENIYLTVLGLGTGNLDDDRLEAISNRGNGTYAYLDSDVEARRVLVEQLTKTLVTVAKDVKLQVEWNPAHVLAYRLIGYENRGMSNRDFDNDAKDAGDLGAGATVTALYEVVPNGPTPVAKPARHLKYQDPPEVPEVPFTGPPVPADVSEEMMTVKVRYKAPEGSESETLEVPLVDDGTTLESASDDFRWAASVAGFGMMLRRSYYKGNAFWGQIHALARGAIGADPNGERTAMLELVAKAGRLYGWR